MMNLKGLEETLSHLFSAIRLCIERRYSLPALQLLYSGIDTLAWLEAAGEADGGVRKRFVSFCERYLLPGSGLNCSALDLYGTRCAVLHTMTADSDLSTQKRARPVLYAWGTASANDLQEALDKRQPDEAYVAVRVNDLLSALGQAGERLFKQADGDRLLGERMAKKAERFLVNVESL